MSAHTPGPWQSIVESEPIADGVFIDSTSIHTAYDHGQLHGPAPVVCLGYSVGSDGAPLVTLVISKDNARLIAAAPELLEALLPMIEGTQWLTSEHVDAARKAIAKAKGEA